MPAPTTTIQSPLASPPLALTKNALSTRSHSVELYFINVFPTLTAISSSFQSIHLTIKNQTLNQNLRCLKMHTK